MKRKWPQPKDQSHQANTNSIGSDFNKKSKAFAIPPRLKGAEILKFRWQWLDCLPSSDPVCARLKLLNIPRSGKRVAAMIWSDGATACAQVPWSNDLSGLLDPGGIHQAYEIGRRWLEREASQ